MRPQPSAKAPTLREPEPGDAARMRGLGVLIVADDPSARVFLTETLSGAGAFVSTAVDGLDATKAGPLGAYDLAILDVTRPTGDGLRLLEAFRRFAPRVRTVAVAAPDATGLDAAARAGADATLHAPYTPERLLAVARSAVERDESHRSDPLPARGAILGASRDGRLLHALQAVSTLCGYVFVPFASAYDATAALGESRFQWVVVDETLADGPGACLVESLPLYSRTPQAILVADRSRAEDLRKGRPSYVIAVEPRPDAAAALRRVLEAS